MLEGIAGRAIQLGTSPMTLKVTPGGTKNTGDHARANDRGR